jgi:N-terminal acetyltransferase B complex non-catalytic subunit
VKLTEAERAFVDYATTLADWLEPYHDHIRPPAAAVLAEASKHGEFKAGHPLRKLNGGADGSGHSKKAGNGVKEKEKDVPIAKEPPVAKEAPDSLRLFFDGPSPLVLCV